MDGILEKFYKPILIGKKLLILPAWIRIDPDRITVKIDPSMALEPAPLHNYVLQWSNYTIPGSVIDIGCGSGILSIGGTALGADRALAVDIDDESMQSSSENAEKWRFRSDGTS